ncbi:hypothetical protein SAMN05443248_7510 [Bradyrhizobium erythrophlei]|jgi:hypothetical protein|uniref:Uncharacterized protein n=1 Tax=Bradyrhizobium erythrophlei TaxID=1437360 RepID=A0A1M5XPM7_9BRAD|nr:hypothetical protein SAMN05443248_7510 [Bradyrhizobium erythrophlei]
MAAPASWFETALARLLSMRRRSEAVIPGRECNERTRNDERLSSLPGLTRQSILFRKLMDARVKPAHDDRAFHASNMITLRTVLPAFIAAKPSLISDSFSFAEIQSSRCNRPRM